MSSRPIFFTGCWKLITYQFAPTGVWERVDDLGDQSGFVAYFDVPDRGDHSGASGISAGATGVITGAAISAAGATTGFAIGAITGAAALEAIGASTLATAGAAG